MKYNSVLLIAPLMIALGVCMPASTVLANPVEAQQTSNGITYINGGVGYEEAKWLDATAKEYPLRLVFSEGQCGRALSDVNVQIINQTKTTVFALEDAGPQILVDLPKGQYKVEAIYKDAAQGARFQVSDGTHKKVVLHWKNCVEEDSLDLPD